MQKRLLLLLNVFYVLDQVLKLATFCSWYMINLYDFQIKFKIGIKENLFYSFNLLTTQLILWMNFQKHFTRCVLDILISIYFFTDIPEWSVYMNRGFWYIILIDQKILFPALYAFNRKPVGLIIAMSDGIYTNIICLIPDEG